MQMHADYFQVTSLLARFLVLPSFACASMCEYGLFLDLGGNRG